MTAWPEVASQWAPLPLRAACDGLPVPSSQARQLLLPVDKIVARLTSQPIRRCGCLVTRLSGSRLRVLDGELLMDDGERPVRAAGPVVVAMPEEIDINNSSQVGRQLSLALLAGATTVIVDFTATTFCGSSGIMEVALAHRQAADMNAELRLVAPSDAVLRVMALTGLDKLAPVYQSLGAALDAHSAAEPAPSPP